MKAVQQPAHRRADSQGRIPLLQSRPDGGANWVLCLPTPIHGLVIVETPVAEWVNDDDIDVHIEYRLMPESGVIFPDMLFRWRDKATARQAAIAIGEALPDVNWNQVTHLTVEQGTRATEAARGES